MDKIVEAIRLGKILLVGEYRGHRVETIRYVDKKTGQAMEFLSIVYLIERDNGREVVLVSQDPGTKNPADVKVKLERGKFYALELTSLENVRGTMRARMPINAQPSPV